MLYLLLISVVLSNEVTVVTFDGADGTTFNWKLVNDPVMGGVSNSTWDIKEKEGIASFQGNCNIVPQLQAPGFCNAETNNGFLTKFADASGNTNLRIVYRSFTDYTGWKVSFAANTLNPQFKSFKADFTVKSDGTWQTVDIPLNQFSNNWSPATGEPVVKCSDDPRVCPTDSDLKGIQQIGLWAEGVEGAFHADFRSIGFSKPERLTTPEHKVDDEPKCIGPIQDNLRYNASLVPWSDDRTCAEVICCDNPVGYAEPQFLFEGLGLFDALDSSGTTTFYDSVCGKPLFTVPPERFQQFKEETQEHGWPSFRDEEMVQENLELKGQVLYSKCGNRLGDNLPDGDGNRYCLDLVCLSGNPVSAA